MQKKHGFTLIEVLIVVAILALLTLIAIVSLNGSRDKADDGVVKADLDRLKIAFEDYYNDQNCYPPLEWFDEASDCGSDHLKPYLNSLPCNRRTGLPYPLRKDATGCTWFKLFGTITNSSDTRYFPFYDTDYTLLGTYAVSSSNIDVYPLTGPVNSPDPEANYSYCLSINDCNPFNPTEQICSPYFINDYSCGGGCTSAGSCTPR